MKRSRHKNNNLKFYLSLIIILIFLSVLVIGFLFVNKKLPITGNLINVDGISQNNRTFEQGLKNNDYNTMMSILIAFIFVMIIVAIIIMWNILKTKGTNEKKNSKILETESR